MLGVREVYQGEQQKLDVGYCREAWC